MSTTTVKQILEAVKTLSPQEQKELLQHLVQALPFETDEFFWLGLAESTFDFWDNSEDAQYDRL